MRHFKRDTTLATFVCLPVCDGEPKSLDSCLSRNDEGMVNRRCYSKIQLAITGRGADAGLHHAARFVYDLAGTQIAHAT